MLSKCLLLSLMVGLVGCGRQSASSPRPKETPVSAGEIGSRLPAFTVDDLQGHKISSADLHGKVVLVGFLGHLVPAVQTGNAGLSKAARPLWRTGSRCCRIQIRHDDGYRRPYKVCREDRRSLSARSRNG